jgi:hypothetical protein
LRNKCSFFSVGGTLLYATWFEIVALYLYLTVGADCYVEAFERYEYLPGGFLGVAANIQTGLLCLALIMMDITRRLLKQVFHIQSQAGGDDFAYLIVVDDRAKEEVSDYVKNSMRTYIGELKEFSVIELDECEEGVLEGNTFCRKRITLKRTKTHTVLGYEPSCPLHASILPDENLQRTDLQCRAWAELDKGLLQYEDEVPLMAGFCDSLREAFLRKYPRVKPVRSKVIKTWPPNGLNGRLRDGLLISDKAFELVEQLPRVDIGPYILLATRASKIRHLQVSEEIRSFEVYYQGSVVTALVLDEEQGSLLTELAVSEAGVHPHAMSLRRILKIVAI